MSVGNLTVGGSGKTPLVAELARWLVAEGERPAILSRGYGRPTARDGVVVVSDGRHLLARPDESGDEPFMLAGVSPGAAVFVADDRHLAGVLAERRFACTVHVLDDGFQHLALARDLDILMTSRGEIPNGRVLPAGRLREPAGAAARADVLVVVDAPADEAAHEAAALGIAVGIGARRVSGAPYLLGAREGGDASAPNLTAIHGRREHVVAVAGIAHPARFFDEVRDAGWQLARGLAFADHHPYTARNVTAIAAAARESGAALVLTTEKDAARLEAAGPLPFDVAVVPMRLELDSPDALYAAVRGAMARARASTAARAVWPPLRPGDGPISLGDMP